MIAGPKATRSGVVPSSCQETVCGTPACQDVVETGSVMKTLPRAAAESARTTANLVNMVVMRYQG